MDDLRLIGNERILDNFIIKIELTYALFEEVFHIVIKIIGIQPTGMNRHPSGNVLYAADMYVTFFDELPRLRHLAVAALINGHVDNDRSGFHAGNHLVGYENRCDLTRYQRAENYYIDISQMAGNERALFFQP